MDRPAVVLSLALLGALAVSAGVTLALAPEREGGVTEADPALGQVPARLAALEQHVTRVEQRLRDLELKPVEPAPSGRIEPLGTPDLVALGDRLAALEAALGQTPQPAALGTLAGDALLTQVGEAVEVLRQQEQDEREQAWEERRAERRAERLAELATELGLDDWQLGEITALLDGAETTRDELRALDDRDAMRAGMQTLAEDLKARAEGILTPSQATQLEELGGLGGFGGGGGPGGGPGGFGGGFGRGRRGR